jgi:SET domain-containing protein
MALLEKQLRVKFSTLPGAGKGLFTTKFIPKGTRIVEYRGKITTWKEVAHDEGNNGYIFYVKRSHVIDARFYPKSIARYANDARGLQKVKGIRNNSEYEIEGLRVYVDAIRDIPAGSEIFVDYGREYWRIIRYNAQLNKVRTKKKGIDKSISK